MPTIYNKQYLHLAMDDLEQLAMATVRAVYSMREEIMKEVRLKPLLTLQEFADKLHVSVPLARDIVTSGKVRYLRVTPTMYRIRQEDADEYLRTIEGAPVQKQCGRKKGGKGAEA